MIKSRIDKSLNIYFKNKKAKDKFFLREGCKVTFSQKSDKIYKIHNIEHRPFLFSGILQIDPYCRFYVKCRNS